MRMMSPDETRPSIHELLRQLALSLACDALIFKTPMDRDNYQRTAVVRFLDGLNSSLHIQRRGYILKGQECQPEAVNPAVDRLRLDGCQAGSKEDGARSFERPFAAIQAMVVDDRKEV